MNEIFVVQIINYEIHHNLISCHIIEVIKRKQIMAEKHNKMLNCNVWMGASAKFVARNEGNNHQSFIKNGGLLCS